MHFGYGTFTLCRQPSQAVLLYIRRPLSDPQPRVQALGLDWLPFARRYLGDRGFFLFRQVLRCFSSLRFLRMSYVFTHG